MASTSFTSVRLIALAILATVSGAAYLGSYWLRFEGDINTSAWDAIAFTLPFVILVKSALFAFFGVHRGWGRYVTFHNLIQIVKSAVAALLVLALLKVLVAHQISIPRSIYILDGILTVVTIGGLRSMTRFLAERDPFPMLERGRDPVLIVGANDSGEALLRAIRRAKNLPYRVVGFITHNRADIGAQVDAIPVLGTLEQTCELAQQMRVKQVLITSGELSGVEVRELIEDAKEHDVEVRVLPAIEQVINGHVSLQPRTVSIEDLLQRDPVSLHTQEISQWLTGRTILVTGSAGSIGSEICRQLLQFQPKKLVVVDRSENGQFFLERKLIPNAGDCELEVCLGDITDARRMEHLFHLHKPEIVFHAAAYKHVPLVEANVSEGIKNIPLATRVLADLADSCGVTSFVMISTDKAVNPTSVMGTCKRVAELYVQALAEHSTCRFVTVRFGNVLDSAGSVVPVFREQIRRGGPVTVTHPDMTRFFMTIPEASQLVIQAGAMGKGGEIFVLDMGEPVRIMNFAEDMFLLSGLEVDQDIEIKIVGLRPGEKLYEELYNEGELLTATPHPKITVASCHQIELEVVREQLAELHRHVDGADYELLSILKTLVPQFMREITRAPAQDALPRRKAA
mgnify:FL=1